MALKDTYFTISEAARELGVTRQTIYRLVTSGQISAEKVGTVTLIPKDKLREYQLERAQISLAEQIINMMTMVIRENYNYNEQDRVDFVQFDRKKTHSFLVTRQDGTREEVLVDIGRVEELSREKGDPFLIFGYKIPIKKIERKISKK